MVLRGAPGGILLALTAQPAFAGATGDEPADGAPLGEALGATAAALVATALVRLLVSGHRSGRVRGLDRLARALERQSGLPAASSR